MLGRSYHKRGDNSEAMKFLHRAQKTREFYFGQSDLRSGEVFLNIGDCHLANGHGMKALEFFHKVIRKAWKRSVGILAVYRSVGSGGEVVTSPSVIRMVGCSRPTIIRVRCLMVGQFYPAKKNNQNMHAGEQQRYSSYVGL